MVGERLCLAVASADAPSEKYVAVFTPGRRLLSGDRLRGL
jgi:hypothetical protein